MDLLDDAAMTAFLRDGFLVRKPDALDDSFHQRLFGAAAELYEEGSKVGGDTLHLQCYGDNLLARIPALKHLLNSPTVTGALTSVLGDGYVLHPHHYVHSATCRDQGFHQDGNMPWNERGFHRSHRNNWAVLFYYPQEVTLENGPTEVVPGTQYWTGDFERDDQNHWYPGDALDREFTPDVGADEDLERRDARVRSALTSWHVEGLEPEKLPVAAGSFVLAHYDLVHRGSRQRSEHAGRRFMYKFYFFRTQAPTAPSWNNVDFEPSLDGVRAELRPVIDWVWHWARGDGARPVRDVPDDQLAALSAALLAQLWNGMGEDERIRAAYHLGPRAAADPELAEDLGRRLVEASEAQARALGHALGLAGSLGASALIPAFHQCGPRARRMAAFALGETGVTSDESLSTLVAGLTDEDALVRSNSAYSLGNLLRCGGPGDAGARVVDALLCRLDVMAEPDNSESVKMTRSTVRQCVAYALCQAAYAGALTDADATRLARQGLADHDRYVQGLTVEALRRVASASRSPGAWLDDLLSFLGSSLYHPRPAAGGQRRAPA